MLTQKVLCIAPGARPADLEAHLRAGGWEVVWADDLLGARRLQIRLQIGLCLLLLDRISPALCAEIETAVRSAAEPAWIAAFPPAALELPTFRELLLDAFLDFHAGPVNVEGVMPLLARAQRRAALRDACRGPCVAAPNEGDLGMVGKSVAMARLRRQLVKVAATNAAVLIGGESGSGKELAAEAIHRGSPRAAGPFVAINCGAIAPSLVQSELFGHERGAFTGALAGRRGRIVAAQGGTLFLDGIGDLPMDVQIDFLRFLQEKTIQRVGAPRSLAVDVRVVAASHVDLAEAVASGKFREDLYRRLNVLSINVPPLRERKEDVPMLAHHFYRRCAAERRARVEGFSRHAISAMLAHDWPGNVRELFNRVQRALVMTDRRLIGPADLELAPNDESVDGLGLDAVRTRAERDAIRSALDRAGHNVSRAARNLGISRMTLYRLMLKHRLAEEAR